MNPTRSPDARVRAFVEWTLRRGAWLWTAALLLGVPAAWRTVDLYVHLRSEIEQLLPRRAPSVVALDELHARMPGVQTLGVVVDSQTAQDLPLAERFLDDLAARVRAYPSGLVSAVRTGDGPERTFLEDHAPLYMDLDDLETVRRRIEARRDWESAKRTGTLLDEDAPAPPLDFSDLQGKYDARTPSAARSANGRYASKDLHLALLLLQLGDGDRGRAQGRVVLDRVRADAADLGRTPYAKALRVGFSGDVAIQVEETEALKSDLSLSAVVVAGLEVAVILFYYRWWRSLVVLFPPLGIAAVLTFGGASLPPLGITELNSNTAFLGSILAGNGINFGVVLLARYLEERRRGADVRDALVRAVAGARTGTSAAAVAAGVSYASLALTDFRGFRQFGILGGLGMALSWLLAFLLMPPLLGWIDRAPRIPPVRRAMMSRVVDAVERGRLAVVAVSLVLTASTLWAIRNVGVHSIETDFSTLRRADTWTRGEGYWGRRMDALLGSYVTPIVILTDGVPQARAIGEALSKAIAASPRDSLVASIRTIDDVVPRHQQEKIAIVEAIRDDLTPSVLSSATPDQRNAIDRILGKGKLPPLSLIDIPVALTMGLRERDGSVGRAVLVFPRPTHALWEGPPLHELVKRLRAAASTRAAPGDRSGRVAGSLPISSDILESVQRDAVLSSAAAFAGAVGAVVVLLRWSPSTGLVLGSLVLGVLWLAGAATALGVKINFANFIAFPITFGIGVDYAVNVATRWEAGGRRAISEAVKTTGGAVVLCSATTIIGYSSLLLAENRALYLFGLLAVLGEIACLTTAIVVLPATVACIQRASEERVGAQ